MPHKRIKELGQKVLSASTRLGGLGARIGERISPGTLGKEAAIATKELGTAIGAAKEAPLGLEAQQRNQRLQKRIQQALTEGRIDQAIAQRLQAGLPRVEKPEILKEVGTGSTETAKFVAPRLITLAAFTGTVAGSVGTAQRGIQQLQSLSAKSTVSSFERFSSPVKDRAVKSFHQDVVKRLGVQNPKSAEILSKVDFSAAKNSADAQRIAFQALGDNVDDVTRAAIQQQSAMIDTINRSLGKAALKLDVAQPAVVPKPGSEAGRRTMDILKGDPKLQSLFPTKNAPTVDKLKFIRGAAPHTFLDESAQTAIQFADDVLQDPNQLSEFAKNPVFLQTVDDVISEMFDLLGLSF